jgi:hypothetical protein
MYQQGRVTTGRVVEARDMRVRRQGSSAAAWCQQTMNGRFLDLVRSVADALLELPVSPKARHKQCS